VQKWFCSFSLPWWIAGGWALDLFLDKVTRAHGDIDVGILRRDTVNACTTLCEWEIFEPHAGFLTLLDPGAAPSKGVNSLWCRRPSQHAWAFELMLDEGGGDEWRFRRDISIRRPFERAIRRSTNGIPYLAPEIQLLYKSKSIRPKDQTDFDAVIGLLDKDARDWLRQSLARMSPNHTWLSVL
jgi:hypothetical protein